MHCLECGVREAKYEGLCEECFLKKVRFTKVPEHIEITECPHCHSIKLGSHWERISLKDAVKSEIERNMDVLHEYDECKISIEYEDNKAEVTVNITYGDLKTQEIFEVSVATKYESCPRCNRFFGNYFEAIIQLRDMREGEVEEILNYVYDRIEHYARKNENLFLTKAVEKREGWDLYLSDKREAKKISREICKKYGATLKESPQIAGRKDGRDVYRVTYAVRFPPYRRGDVVEVEGRVYVVSEISDSYVHCISLDDGSKKSIDSKKHTIRTKVKGDELESALVIYKEGETVEIMDKNNVIMDITTRLSVEEGRYVKIAKVDDEIYILPANWHTNPEK